MMSYPNVILLLNLTLSATLTGLIWMVQIVHYPGFLGVGTEQFLAYQHNHMRTISYVVVPLMLGELVVGLMLPFVYPSSWPWLVYTSAGLVLVIWITTFFVSSPLHGLLASEGYNTERIERLVSTNWIRTAAWTVRTVILFYIVLTTMRS